MTIKQIRSKLFAELKIVKLSGKPQVWAANHCCNLIIEREDLDRIEEVIDLYLIKNFHLIGNIQKFYWWYKDNRISRQDYRVYHFFDKQSEVLGFDPADPIKFCGIGEELINRIIRWKGNSGNSIDNILSEYFKSILPQAIKFNSTLMLSPKSLLQDFGWNLWGNYLLAEYGGKNNYLTASAADLKNAKSNSRKLQKIQGIKDQLLIDSNIEEYDRIGKILTTNELGDAYEKICQR